MRRTCFTIFGIVLLAHPLLGQCRAEVAGTVVNESGAPIEGALVSLKAQAPTGGPLALRYFKTNEDGVFNASLDLDPGRPPGLYRVMAKKEEAGYPEEVFAFYLNSEPLQVDLDCGSHISDVLVQLGPKCGYITRIDIVDAATGALIKNGTITLRRVHPPLWAPHPEVFWMSSNAPLHEVGPGYPGLPIPANTEISTRFPPLGTPTSEPRTIQVAPSKSVEIPSNCRSLPIPVGTHDGWVHQGPKCEGSPPHGPRPVRGDPGPGAPTHCGRTYMAPGTGATGPIAVLRLV